MNKKFYLVIQIAYIILAIFCLSVAISKHLKLGASHLITIAWYAMTVISVLMFLLRRMQQKNIERRKNRFR